MANAENTIDISMVKFDEKGLVPAVVQEENGQVLMLAYMNEESLKKTLETGYTWLFSRSRQKLWQKGETSGNVQKVKEISYDCDGDTLLVRVHQTGVACHTGTYTCFSGRKLAGGEEKGIAVVPPKKADRRKRSLSGRGVPAKPLIPETTIPYTNCCAMKKSTAISPGC